MTWVGPTLMRGEDDVSRLNLVVPLITGDPVIGSAGKKYEPTILIFSIYFKRGFCVSWEDGLVFCSCVGRTMELKLGRLW